LTYNGFGGQIPASYRELCVDHALPNALRLWRKTNRLRTRRASGSSDEAGLGNPCRRISA
jgi:hypothetical protein